MEQQTLDLAIPPPSPPPKHAGGRPRKWKSEADRREDQNEKRRQTRAARRANQDAAGTPVSAPSLGPAARSNAAREAGRAARVEKLALPLSLEVRDEDLHELAYVGVLVGGERVKCPNIAEAFQYARDVLDGRVVVCRDVVQACERHARDLERLDDAGWPFTFDAPRAENVLAALQKFREYKGRNQGHQLRLAPWQRFIYASLFGWIRKDNATRRFRYAFVAVPRG